MSWHGANTLQQRGGGGQGTHRSSEPRRETVEANVNRLRKSYALAMQCVGAFHRADAAISESRTNDPSAHNSLLRVARAARRTFERSILLDALVDTPSWTRTFQDGMAKPPSLVQLTSTRDKSTVQQLAYLSLVNYADLLLMGLPPSQNGGTAILDHGLVKCLPSFRLNTNFTSCWTSGSDSAEDDVVFEPEEVTVRFALVAYIDATSLDASDPTVWLKLACAARRLSHCDGLPVVFGKYRRLERYSLERAVSALPLRDPPNRVAVQALREWHKEAEETQEYPNELVISRSPPLDIVLELPRYSWSTLGRLLLRACKDGTLLSLHNHDRGICEGSYALSKPVFLSPNVTIRVSPLLALSTPLLAAVISYLPSSQLWRLEATCRALSASVIASRVLLQDQGSVRRRSVEANPLPPDNTPEEDENGPLTETSLERNSDKAPIDQVAAETSKRISKRLQSQVLTSGKRSERSARRQSVDFCLRAAIFGCSADDPTYIGLIRSYDEIHSASLDSSARKSEEYAIVSSDKNEALDQRNAALLLDFVADDSSSRSPLAWLFRFVSHVSMNVAQTFTNDPAGVMGMNSILLDCLHLMNRRSDLRNELVVCWSQNSNGAPSDAGLHVLELFAIDLIHAELRLRRCDMEEASSIDFDCDANFVGLLIPSLVKSFATLEEQLNFTSPVTRGYCKSLKVRLYWLRATWYLWRSQQAVNVMDSRDAEMKGLEWIETIKRCLQIGDVIPTPHLVSPTRVGLHWKEVSLSSISSFADEIQASAVVLLAQEQFMDVARKYESQSSSQMMKPEDCKALSSIGETLMLRYPCAGDGSSKFFEIIDDFFNVHGETFYSLALSPLRSSDSTQKWFHTVVPSRRIEAGRLHIFPSSPCVLTILVNCLCTKQGHCKQTVLLLSNLVITLLDLSDKLLLRKRSQLDRKIRSHSANDFSSSCSSDSDDSMSCSDDDDEKITRKQNLNADDFKTVKYAACIRVLLTRILSICTDSMSSDESVSYVQSPVFENLLKRTLCFTTELFRCSRPVINDTDIPDEDLGILLAIRRLFHSFVLTDDADSTWCLGLSRIYIEGLFYIVTDQRRILSNLSKKKPNKNGRALRLKSTRKRADLVAVASFDAGSILSKNLALIDAGRIVRSNLFGERESHLLRASSLAAYLDSLLWFWKASLDGSVNSNSDKRVIDETHLSAYLDGFGRERLRVPIAMAIVGLCGSALHAKATTEGALNDVVSLKEFYDSDASVIEWMSNEANDVESFSNSKKDTIRVIAQAVHCVKTVFGLIDEKEVCSYSYIESYTSSNGPGLALVVTRVLNFFASVLLVQFKGKGVDALEALWKDYPYGTQTTGSLLDSILWKAYKCLHGFVLTNDVKESVSCSGSSSKPSQHFLPESKEAGAMLYRCIMRAYSHGRRTPPKAALDAVLAVLPKKEDSRKMSSIRNFLFSPSLREGEMEQLLLLTSQHPDSDAICNGTNDFNWLTTVEDDCDDESSRVLHGLSRLISQGPIPRIPDCGDERDWRSLSTQSEEELSTKFNALIDNLCFGNTKDWEGWFKASQCANMKSDLIADRLGLSRGFTRSHNFYAHDRRLHAESNVELADLLLLQEREQLNMMKGRVQCLGADLSLFVRFYWSSSESLNLCFQEICQFYEAMLASDSTQTTNDSSNLQVWHEIKNLFEKNAISRWQHGMGGLFVASLRVVAYRCLLVSLYLLNNLNVSDKDLFKSELSESLGVSLYVELMGSQEYGYPMKCMTDLRKRNLAIASSSFFEQAIKLTQGEDELSGRVETWDLLFMMGKCQEKIARTYDREAFVLEPNDDRRTRRYEHHMAKAIDAYALSIAHANKVKKEGGFIAEHNGGSAHGVSEAVYRLHATRLKCLISAVDKTGDERDLAELESLRLTERHWFQVSDDAKPDCAIRQRVWMVLVDVVGALAKLSLDNSYFHRSVYRHAQALLWAPVLYDPEIERNNLNVESIPAIWACKVRGLNYASNAAYSALSVISSLFSKKRTQLVAVWVTSDGSPTTFQSINSSARKYDSLRGKYIAAYLDCLRLCRRRKELDVFLSWTTSCPRDLPSHFSATADNSNSRQGLSFDSLVLHNSSPSSLHFLTSVRRMANSALANVILEDMNEYKLKEKVLSSIEVQKYYETQLKLAYACFLRLNCDVGALSKSRTWMFHRQNGVKDVVDALTFAFVNTFKDKSISAASKLSDWSGDALRNETLVAAVSKCKELFPSLSRNYSFSRQRTQQKVKGMDSSTSSKRKVSPNHEKRYFEVPIPNGLKEGDSFLTSVMVGETLKRVRLTVPSESASSLRFSLQVPVDGSKPTASS